jgi:hypothetical protein
MKQHYATRRTLSAVAISLFVALADAMGGLPRAKAILRDAIDDRAIDDPEALAILANIAAEYPEDAEEHFEPIVWHAQPSAAILLAN